MIAIAGYSFSATREIQHLNSRAASSSLLVARQILFKAFNIITGIVVNE
jgi:hypothetical protein